MKVTLLSSTVPSNEDITLVDVLYTEISQCYHQHFDLDDANNVSYEKKKKVIQKVLSSGHESVTEHISFSFLIEEVSRVTTHQLVRHRIASYTQRSGRYTGIESGDFVVVPPSIKSLEEFNVFNNCVEECRKAYTKLCELGIPKEDARYIIPQGSFSNIITTMNIRTLKNFFGQRLCSHAQWEIQELAQKMSNICKIELPLVFEEFKWGYSKCEQNGFCKEFNCCGRKKKLDI